MEPAATRPEDLLVHSQWLRALALRLAADEATADDLVQETWLAAVKHPPRHEGSRRWLARVLTNKARERRRATGRRARREESVARSEGGVPSTVERNDAVRRQLRDQPGWDSGYGWESRSFLRRAWTRQRIVEGVSFVAPGGCFLHSAAFARSASRDKYAPSAADYALGVRPACAITGEIRYVTEEDSER